MKPQMNTVQPSRNQKTHREDAKNAKFLKSLFFASSCLRGGFLAAPPAASFLTSGLPRHTIRRNLEGTETVKALH